MITGTSWVITHGVRDNTAMATFNTKVGQDDRGDLYDADSGEYHEPGTVLAVLRKRPGLPYKRCFLMNQDALLKAMAQSNLGSEAYRVFFALCSSLDFENLIAVEQADLAQTIGMQKQNFARGIKRLVTEGVIEQGPVISGRRTFRLSPDYGWKGSTAQLHKLQKSRGHLQRVK